MKSSSASRKPKPAAASPLTLSVQDLSLVFRVQTQRPLSSLREVFIAAVRDPVAYFLAEKERLVVARDLCFEVRAGERVGLMGVNGAGKTSLCRCIAGMYAPTAGKVSVYGRLRAIFDTGIGIQPELTGFENAQLLARFMYPEEVGLKALIEEALEFSELGHFIHTPFKFYSNGMQTRLALSLVSARPCDLLILDEVFDGADVFFREKVSKRVLRMIEDSGAVIFVSHQAEQIELVCNRVLVLSGGGIGYDGDVKGGLAYFQKLNPRAVS